MSTQISNWSARFLHAAWRASLCRWSQRHMRTPLPVRWSLSATHAQCYARKGTKANLNSPATRPELCQLARCLSAVQSAQTFRALMLQLMAATVTACLVEAHAVSLVELVSLEHRRHGRVTLTHSPGKHFRESRHNASRQSVALLSMQEQASERTQMSKSAQT